MAESRSTLKRCARHSLIYDAAKGECPSCAREAGTTPAGAAPAAGPGPAKGLPPRILLGVVGGVIAVIVGLPIARSIANRPAPSARHEASAAEEPPTSRDANSARLDPEEYREQVQAVENAVYTEGGFAGLGSAASELERAVTNRNMSNPMARAVATELQVKLLNLAEWGVTRVKAATAAPTLAARCASGSPSGAITSGRQPGCMPR